MDILKKRKEFIISPVDIETSCTTRINQFCKLLRLKLSNHWIVNNENSTPFDVQIKKYQQNSFDTHDKSIPTIYLVYHEEQAVTKEEVHNMWLLHYPIFSHTLVPLLNEISKNIKKPVSSNQRKIISQTFKEKFSNFLKKPFSNHENELEAKSNLKSIQLQMMKQQRQKKYVNSLLDFFKPDKKQHAKIVFLGRPGSGKTTAIMGITNKPILTTEVKATDHVGLIKTNTTIGIDYGEYENDLITLKLYGTPGQQRYDYMRRLVINNVDAYIILVDLSSETPLAEVAYYSNIIQLNSGSNANVIYAFTHNDLSSHNTEYIGAKMKELYPNALIISMDPRDRYSVKRVLDKLADALKDDSFLKLSKTGIIF
ncbi:MAG: 50S ribosome-binding GTPase [Xanthomonadales bacterium]|nr:50S ribosome-binding GTPase [Xanthomonadales bacterium]